MKVSRQFIGFCAVGSAGLVVDVAMLAIARGALGVYGARAVSFLAAATATWLLNRRFTFSEKRDRKSHGIVGEYAHYLGIMATGGAVNYGTYSVLALNLDQSPWALSAYVAIGSFAGLAVNYLGASRWLYRTSTTD